MLTVIHLNLCVCLLASELIVVAHSILYAVYDDEEEVSEPHSSRVTEFLYFIFLNRLTTSIASITISVEMSDTFGNAHPLRILDGYRLDNFGGNLHFAAHDRGLQTA